MFPGWAKRMAELQMKAYQIRRFGVLPLSQGKAVMFMVQDNFDPENAMVIPNLLAKFDQVKTQWLYGVMALP